MQCTADAAIACTADTYQPLFNQSRQTACTPCNRIDIDAITAGLPRRTSLVDCVCRAGYYNHNASVGSVNCRECVSGTQCSRPGTVPETLPIKRGYYRLSSTSLDIRRCPDAGVNCTNAPECAESTSGCRGFVDIRAQGPEDTLNPSQAAGWSSNASNENITLCRQGLKGAFCLLCEARDVRVFYAAATTRRPARCDPCRETVRDTILIALSLVLALVAIRDVLKAFPRASKTAPGA